MVLPPAPKHSPSLMMIEAGLTAIACAVAFCWPRVGAASFSRIERAFGSLARKKGLSVAVVGLSAFLLRLAILPLCPIPDPFVHDGFSFLLAADTFASGRLTNPTPVMWKHFESFHITMQPTYMSMYFPAQGMALAAGKVLTGHEWYGLLAVTALMCAAICWMLQAWLPPSWALLGGLLAVLRLGLFSYWIDTYSGAGSVAALGGALVLGGAPRLMRSARGRDGVLIAIGIILLVTSRPCEGFFLCLPVAFVLGRWMLFGKNRPAASVLARRAVLPVTLILLTAGWMGYYNHRVFGSALTPPYAINRATYARVPYFVWQSPRPEPTYRHREIKRFYDDYEFKYYKKSRTPTSFLLLTLGKPLMTIQFFAGFALLPPLIMLRRVLLDHRFRLLVICTLVLMAGLLGEVFLIQHYLAPFTAVFYALGLQAMRHLRVWKVEGQPVGLGLVRLLVTVCVVLAVLRTFDGPLHIRGAAWPGSDWRAEWYGPGQFGAERAEMKARLEKMPGGQLAIVRYSAAHDPLDEWVYNAADIDHAKVIWARDMGEAGNRELIDYYKDRAVWLIEPDTEPATVSPYMDRKPGLRAMAVLPAR